MAGLSRFAPGGAGHLRLAGARYAWLSITPEPERELPGAIAELRGTSAEKERELVESLVTRASKRAWKAYLGEVSELARTAPPGEARDIVLDVIENHNNLKLGLPGERS
ncbi:MAG: hypothetical protein M3550_16145 [Actinomycetota bacterium]|nr:hypothetical protein [Actinomycetota bacterium]